MTDCEALSISETAQIAPVELEKSDPTIADDEKPVESKRISYAKETLLELRSAPASLERPKALKDSFFNSNGLWDPVKWHANASSRGPSPLLNSKAIPREEKKAVDMIEDSVELMPQRRSFHQGCQVQQSSEPSKSDNKLISIQNKKNLVFSPNDGKKRLTGRAAGQRKVLERTHFREKDYPINDNDNRKLPIRNTKTSQIRDEKKGRRSREEVLPEWVTDGPSSQSDVIELKGFDDHKKKKNQENDEKPKKQEEDSNKGSKEPRQMSLKEEAELLHAITSRGASPAEGFDLNAFLTDGGDYLPSDLFTESDTTEASTKSKFSQFFQLSQSSSGASRPNSNTSGMDEQSWKEPSENPYFMPIQPASNARAPNQPQSLLDILQRGKKSSDNEPTKEIKGRMNADEVEAHVIGKQVTDSKQTNEGNDSTGASAFGKFIAAMKEAGHLPEKPAPVVVGLPEHLLPKPPKQSSPSFEKLKRALNRSPSPVLPPPQLLNGSQPFNQEHQQSHVNPNVVTRSEHISNPMMFNSPMPTNYMANHVTPSSTNQSSSKLGKENKTPYVPAAFTPTSVIRKIHNDLHGQKSSDKAPAKPSKDNITQSDVNHPNQNSTLPESATSNNAIESTASNHPNKVNSDEDHIRNLFDQLASNSKQSKSSRSSNVSLPTSMLDPQNNRENKNVSNIGPIGSKPNNQNGVSANPQHHLPPHMIPGKQNMSMYQGQHLLNLLQQTKDRPNNMPRVNGQSDSYRGDIGQRLPFQNQNQTRQQLPQNMGILPPAAYQGGIFPPQQMNMNRNSQPPTNVNQDIFSKQNVNQQQLIQQQLIHAAHAMQQQQQHQQQLERQLAIQRSLSINRQRFPFNQQHVPFQQRGMTPNQAAAFAQRMTMKNPGNGAIHRPLPTPMLPQHQYQSNMQQQANQHQHHGIEKAPGAAIGSNTNGRDNALTRLFDNEVLRMAGARNGPLPSSKALTLEEIEALNK